MLFYFCQRNELSLEHFGVISDVDNFTDLTLTFYCKHLPVVKPERALLKAEKRIIIRIYVKLYNIYTI